MTPSDFAIVTLPPDLAAYYVADRMLVEAVEMHGSAEVVGIACNWLAVDGGYRVRDSAWLDLKTIPDEHRATFERLFTKARRQAQGPDYHDVRHGWRNAKPASEPLRPGAPVRYQPGRRTR